MVQRSVCRRSARSSPIHIYRDQELRRCVLCISLFVSSYTPGTRRRCITRHDMACCASSCRMRQIQLCCAAPYSQRALNVMLGEIWCMAAVCQPARDCAVMASPDKLMTQSNLQTANLDNGPSLPECCCCDGSRGSSKSSYGRHEVTCRSASQNKRVVTPSRRCGVCFAG